MDEHPGGWLQRLRVRLAATLAARVVWLTDARRDARGNVSDAAALIAVLGREHYDERRRTYPVAGWRDLRRVLRQEPGLGRGTLCVIGPLVEDHREVVFYEPRPGALDRAGRAVWILPESLLLARMLPDDAIAKVERAGFRYFLAPDGRSQPVAGAIVSAELFLLAVGMDGATRTLDWGPGPAAVDPLRALTRVPLRAWIAGFRGPEAAAAQIPWRVLGMLVAAALVVHLGIASVYLSLTTRARERELEGLGGEVASLLKQQRQVERMSAEKAAIGALLRERHPAHEPWRIAAVAWRHGARIARLNFVDGVLTVTGTAPAATDVLAALAATPGVSEAKFVAPVRREQADREEFSISLRIAGGTARGG
jgi:hypothetical protein